MPIVAVRPSAPRLAVVHAPVRRPASQDRVPGLAARRDRPSVDRADRRCGEH
jgi:hypothetical protein